MDDLEEQAQLGISLQQEGHRLDTMVRTPDDDDSLWRLERHLVLPILSIHHPNDLPLEARALHLGACHFFGPGFWLWWCWFDTWNLLDGDN